MTLDALMTKCWPEMLRSCWLGNSIVTNLQEPSIQLDEFKTSLSFFQECVEKEMFSSNEQKMLVEELGRQVEFMTDFYTKLQSVLASMASVARGDRGAI